MESMKRRVTQPTPRSPHLPQLLMPIVKWAGGKRWLLKTTEFQRLHTKITVTLWNRHRSIATASPTLIEPFAGGMAIGLGLGVESAIMNDVNKDLINLYRQIKDGSLDYFHIAQLVNMPDANTRSCYDAIRVEFNKRCYDAVSQAALFYYLNKTGFNGLCRYNRQGGYNVPFGKRATVNYALDVESYRNHFAGWQFTCDDFSTIDPPRGSWIYADPPYHDTFTDYAPGGFDWSQQVKLAQWLKVMSDDGVPFIASNSSTPQIIELYGDLGFTVTEVIAPRRISANGDRTPATEVLISNVG